MRKNKILFWTATIILVLFEGVMPLATLLFATEYATAGTKPLGYPDYFSYALIVCKILGVTAITVPQIPAKVKEWAYAGLTFNLLFAALSHAIVDGNVGYVIMPLVILGIVAVSYRFNPQLNNQG